MNDLVVIVLNYNTRDITLDCLKSISKSNPDIPVVIVDNASTDGSQREFQEKFPQYTLIANNENVGFAGGNNSALKKLHGKYRYYLLLNSDTLVEKVNLREWVKIAEDKNFDISGCLLVDASNRFQPNAGLLPFFMPTLVWLSGLDDVMRKVIRIPSYQERNLKYYEQTKLVGWVGGTVMLISNDSLDKIGFLDEKIFMYGEDVEYCLRASKKNLKVGWVKELRIKHLGGASSEKPQYNQWLGEIKGMRYIYNKHFGKFKSIILFILLKIFIPLRALAFKVIGNEGYAKTYISLYKSI